MKQRCAIILVAVLCSVAPAMTKAATPALKRAGRLPGNDVLARPTGRTMPTGRTESAIASIAELLAAPTLAAHPKSGRAVIAPVSATIIRSEVKSPAQLAPLLVTSPIRNFGFLPAARGSAADKALGPSRPNSHAPAKPGRPPDLPTPPGPLPTAPASTQSSTHPNVSAAAPSFTSVAPASTNVQLDNSLGQSQQPVITTNAKGENDFAIYGTMGKQIGGNLFFSFSSFNLATNESATFSGPFTLATSVQNILARVTGGASSIDGLISTSHIPGANFFLINSAGVMFGPNASLDLGGSFIVSTADYLKLANGARFDALPSPNDAALSAAPVAAFGFLNPNPNGVQISGSQFSVLPNTGLHVVAGSITLDGATLSAFSGDITLFSASSAGEVPFDLSGPGAGYAAASATAGGSIKISNQSTLAIDGLGGGLLTIYGGTITLDNSTVSSNNFGALTGGPITIQAQTLSVLDGARIASTANGIGNGGSVLINANTVTVDGDNGTRASALISQAFASSGNADTLTINAGQLTLTDGGFISGSSFSAGGGATVMINANTLSISGSTLVSGASGIFSGATSSGNAGSISIDVAGAATIEAGGDISASTGSTGNGGAVVVTAGTLAIDGSATPALFTGLATGSNPGAAGNAGSLDVKVLGALSITGGGEISASTFSTGAGGNLSVTASSLTIDGSAPSAEITGIFTNANRTSNRANAGNLTVTVENGLTITGGGEIAAGTFSSGNGGKLDVRAGTLTIDGSATPSAFTGIASEANSSATGAAGNLTVNVTGALSISGSGEIAASTFSTGAGGDLNVTASSLTIDGTSTATQSNAVITGIEADSEAKGKGGKAGNLTIKVGGALKVLGSGEIDASTYSTGPAGNLRIKASSLLVSATSTASNSSANVTGIFAESDAVGKGGHSGSLTLNVTNLLRIARGGEISADTYSTGNAHDLSITAGYLKIDGSAAPAQFTGISAGSNDSAKGSAGTLTIDVRGKLTMTGGGEIEAETAFTGNGGDLFVDASSIFIDGTATANNANSFTTGILADSNATGRGGNAGNLTVEARNKLTILGGGEISATTFSLGHAGNLTVKARSITIDGSLSGIFANSGGPGTTAPTGKAGTAFVSARRISITNGARIIADAFSSGDGGKLTINAGTLSIDGSAAPGDFTGISASTNPGASGSAGDLTVNLSGALSISNTGVIEASTSSVGRGGNLTVEAKSITIDGSGAPLFDTGILTESDASGVGGNAGNLTVAATDALTIVGSGKISANTSSSGNGGKLDVVAGSLTIDGSATPQEFTGITAGSERGAMGNAGDLTVSVAKTLSISGAGTIAADAFSSGHSGRLTVNANRLTIDGSATPTKFTGIAAQADPGSTGNAGDLTVNVSNLLEIDGHGTISASTFSSGNAGDLTITAGSVTIDGFPTPGLFTGIAAGSDPGATGRAGNVTVISTGALQLLAGGAISALSVNSASSGNVSVLAGALSLDSHSLITSANIATGGAGSVQIETARTINLSQLSSISVQALEGNAGDITLSSGGPLALHDSQITAQAGLTGGNITLSPSSLVLDDSRIDANAGQGAGGLITINLPADAVLGNASSFYIVSPYVNQSGNSLISASSDAGIPGALLIAAPQVEISNGLVGLPGSLLDASSQLRDLCAVRIGSDFSSFLVRGSEGIIASPDEAQAQVNETGGDAPSSPKQRGQGTSQRRSRRP